jgi:hypothetical protein
MLKDARSKDSGSHAARASALAGAGAQGSKGEGWGFSPTPGDPEQYGEETRMR